MSQDKLFKMLSGAGAALNNAKNLIKQNTSQYFEETIGKGKYVSREEFDKLKKLVMKQQSIIDKLSKTDNNKK